jgi:hypothetical protein
LDLKYPNGENKGGDGKGPRDEEITLLSYITKSPPTTSGFLLERKINKNL